MEGTLTYPVNFKKGKTPVVLMVTGSGQQNRDEEVFEHRPFAVIADYFARHGIATLRYDDRNFGQSKGGDVAHATTQDFAQDAEAGINYLRKQHEFGWDIARVATSPSSWVHSSKWISSLAWPLWA